MRGVALKFFVALTFEGGFSVSGQTLWNSSFPRVAPVRHLFKSKKRVVVVVMGKGVFPFFYFRERDLHPMINFST